MSRTSKSRTEDFDLDNFEEDLVFEVLYMMIDDGEDDVKYLVLDNIEDVVLDVEGRGRRPRRRGRQFDCFYIICII